jgi:hypothetical protein
VPDWPTTHRLIPSRFPTVGLFDRIADPADLDAVFAVEALTNPRIRDEIGQLQLVPPEERLSGPGSTPVMAAFTHLNPDGSRFSDGSFGVYYAADRLETAVAEVAHHRAVFLARTAEPPTDIDLRLIQARVVQPLHDLRGLRAAQPGLYDPVHYGSAQALGRDLRAAGSWGVLYHSVRWPEGLCVGLFRPRSLQPALATRHLAMHWNGHRISHWYEKQAPLALP